MKRTIETAYLYGWFLFVCAVIGVLAATVVVNVTTSPVIAAIAVGGIVAYVEMGRETWRALA